MAAPVPDSMPEPQPQAPTSPPAVPGSELSDVIMSDALPAASPTPPAPAAHPAQSPSPLSKKMRKLLERGHLPNELLAALSNSTPHPWFTSTFHPSPPNPMATAPALGLLGIPFTRSILRSLPADTVFPAAALQLHGSVSLGAVQFKNPKYESWIEELCGEFAGIFGVEDARESVQCTLKDVVVVGEGARLHGLGGGKGEEGEFATVLVVPPGEAEWSVRVFNRDRKEMRAVYGGAGETAGSTVVVGWRCGTWMDMEVGEAPVLGFVYSLRVRDEATEVPECGSDVAPEERVRELLEVWATWQDLKDKQTAVARAPTMVWYETEDKVSKAAMRTLQEVATGLGLQVWEATMTVERSGQPLDPYPDMDDDYVDEDGDYNIDPDQDDNISVVFKKYRSLVDPLLRERTFHGAQRLDAKTLNAFSEDLLLPASGPTLYKELGRPARLSINGDGTWFNEWEVKALVIWPQKSHGATVSRLFGPQAPALLRYCSSMSDKARKSFLHDLIHHLKSNFVVTGDRSAQLRARQTTRDELYNVALEWDDSDALRKIAQKWGLPGDTLLASDVVEVLKEEGEAAEVIAYYCYDSLKALPTWEGRLKELDALVHGDKEMMGRVVKTYLLYNTQHVLDEEELEKICTALGEEWIEENESIVTRGHPYTDSDYWLKLFSLLPDSYDITKHFARIIKEHSPVVTGSGMLATTENILQVFCIPQEAEQMPQLPILLDKIASFPDSRPSDWAVVLQQVLKTFQDAELPLAGHLSLQLFVVSVLRKHILPTVPPKPTGTAAPDLSLPPLPRCTCQHCNLLNIVLSHQSLGFFDIGTTYQQALHLQAQFQSYSHRHNISYSPVPPSWTGTTHVRKINIPINQPLVAWEAARKEAECIINTLTDKQLGALASGLRSIVTENTTGFTPEKQRIVDAWLQKVASDIHKLFADEQELRRLRPLRQAVALEMADTVYKDFLDLHKHLQAQAPKPESPPPTPPAIPPPSAQPSRHLPPLPPQPPKPNTAALPPSGIFDAPRRHSTHAPSALPPLPQPPRRTSDFSLPPPSSAPRQPLSASQNTLPPPTAATRATPQQKQRTLSASFAATQPTRVTRSTSIVPRTPTRRGAGQGSTVPPPSTQPVGTRKRAASGTVPPPSTQPTPRGSARKRVRGVDVIDLSD